MKIRLITRIKLALKAFRCQPFSIYIDGYSPSKDSALRPGHECDSNWHVERVHCGNEAEVCLSRTAARLTFDRDDHEHLCNQCAAKIAGKYFPVALHYNAYRKG